MFSCLIVGSFSAKQVNSCCCEETQSKYRDHEGTIWKRAQVHVKAGQQQHGLHGWNLLWQHPIYYHEVLSFQPAPKIVTSTKSELEGKDQITTGILVHMATQIANALASCNFVHRDLATWNCMAWPKVPGEDRQILVLWNQGHELQAAGKTSWLPARSAYILGTQNYPPSEQTLMNSSKCSLLFAVVSEYSTNSL